MAATPRRPPDRILAIVLVGLVAAGLIVAAVLVAATRPDDRASGTGASAATEPRGGRGTGADRAPTDGSSPPGPSGSAPVPPSAATAPTTAPPALRPTIEAGGDLGFRPTPAGPSSPTTAASSASTGPSGATVGDDLAASFELAFTAQDSTVQLSWPPPDVSGFDHYVVLRRAAPAQPEETPVGQLSDPAATSFAEDLATAVTAGTPQVSYRVAVVDGTGAAVKVSTTVTLALGWP